MVENPYLTVVVGTRNDNHGGDILARMLHCFHSLKEQADAFRLPTELLVVEWNPPADRGPLLDAAEWPGSSEYFSMRIVTVGSVQHRRNAWSDRIPFFQYLAKNVGLRRARGSYILATNVDVIFSDALFGRLAARDLRPGFWYRADRWDVDPSIPVGIPAAERQRRCLTGLKKINHRFGALWAHDLVIPAFESMTMEEAITDIASQAAVEVEGLPDSVGPYLGRQIHFNACGDFTLMHRDDWDRLNGYPELPIHSWHFDSIFLIQAYEAGLRECFFGYEWPVFHLDHDPGWGLDAFTAFHHQMLHPEDGSHRLVPRPTRVPVMDWDSVVKDFIKPVTGRGLVTFNPSGWGLAGEDLPESMVS